MAGLNYESERLAEMRAEAESRTEVAYPLNDTPYIAEDAQLWHSTRTQGVYSSDTHLITRAAGGMQVAISAGIAWIKAGEFENCVYGNKEEKTFIIDTADGRLPRIDRVVIRWDKVTNTVTLIVKKGTPAPNPQPPALVRNAEAYEIGIANVRVPAGALAITQANIYDTRLDEYACGIMRDGVTKIPTEQLYSAWTSWYNQLTYNAEKQVADKLNQWDILVNSLIEKSNNSYVEFAKFMDEMRQASESDYKELESHIKELTDNSDESFAKFVVWLNNYKIEVAGEFDEWLKTLKDKLGGDIAGSLQNQIDELKEEEPTVALGTVVHNLGRYPICHLYEVDGAAGVGGASAVGAGGSPLTRINGGFKLIEFDKVVVSAPPRFKDCTDINKISENQYAFTPKQSDIYTTSLFLILK